MSPPRPDPAFQSASAASAGHLFWLYARHVIFVAVHVVVIVTAAMSELTPGLVALALVSFLVRMWGVAAGYHRYYAHRAFETSRGFAIFLAILAQSANQNGVLWWAARHRHHHRHSDKPEDVHSPAHHGFLRSHVTWFMRSENWGVDASLIPDLMSRRELRLLQQLPFLPSVTLGVVLFAAGGWPALLWGHFVPSVVLLHATFLTNSVTHMFGYRNHDTRDNSRNNLWCNLLSLGEGLHNNHHHAPGAAIFSCRWFEFDAVGRSLWLLEKLGIVWGVRRVPRRPDR